jgi:tetratricopeptide (TPR) repeat protein
VSKGDLAAAMHSRGALDEAIRIYYEVLEAKERVMGPDHAETHKTRANIGTSLHSQRKFLEARELEQAAAAGLDRALGPADRSTLMVKQNLAATLRELGELDRALLIHQEVLHHQKSVLGESHPDVEITKYQLAATLDAHKQRGTVPSAEAIASTKELNDTKSRLENVYSMGMSSPTTSLREPRLPTPRTTTVTADIASPQSSEGRRCPWWPF